MQATRPEFRQERVFIRTMSTFNDQVSFTALTIMYTDSFALEYRTVVWLCQYLQTRIVGITQVHRESLVFYESLHFLDQVSSHHQNLGDVVSLCHF